MNQQHLTNETIIDYLHGELAPEDDAGFLMHLETCPPCRAQYQTEARLTDALRTYALAAERDLPAGVVNGIWDTIDAAARPNFGARVTSWLRPAFALPLAAAAALVLYFGYSADHTQTRPTIDAAYYLDEHAAMTSTVPFGEGSAIPSELQADRPAIDAHVVAVQTVLTTADATR